MDKLKLKKPKIKDDVHYFRSILNGVNNKWDLTAEVLDLPIDLFRAYLDALLEQKIIKRYLSTPIDKTSNYIIYDIEEYRRKFSGNIYEKIEKYIIPLLPEAIMLIKK